MKNITKFINESIKAKLLPLSNKSYFSKEAINFINNVVGTKWYIIINEEPNYNKIETLIKNINKTDKFSDDDFSFTSYIDDKKRIKVVHITNGINNKADAFIIDKVTKNI